MKRTLIRYKTKPESADKNAELIAEVFAELKAAKPDGVRYLSLRLDDDSFVHVVETEDEASSTLPGLAAFKAFQSGIRERCIEPPVVEERDHRRQLSHAGASHRDMAQMAGVQHETGPRGRRLPLTSTACSQRCAQDCIAIARAWLAR